MLYVPLFSRLISNDDKEREKKKLIITKMILSMKCKIRRYSSANESASEQSLGSLYLETRARANTSYGYGSTVRRTAARSGAETVTNKEESSAIIHVSTLALVKCSNSICTYEIKIE